MAHIVGIIYHMVALIEIQYLDSTETWIHIRNIQNSSWQDKYVQALYWSVSTMVTILLYLPETNTETIFAIVSIFIMTGVFGYSLNTIGIIITEMNKKQKEMETTRQMACRFFKKRQISDKLKERITLYLDFVFQENKKNNLEEEELVLQKLSNQLKLEVKRHINQQYLGYLKFFMQKFSEEAQDNILQIIVEEHYSPDEQLTNINFNEENTNKGINDPDYFLYIIVKGKLQIYYQKDKISDKIPVKNLKQNDIIGLESFLTGQENQFKARSLESCLLLKLSRKKFLNIIYSNQSDIELFQMMADQYYQSETSSIVKNDCILCHRNHSFKNCTETNIQIDKRSTIYNYKHLNAQIRQTFSRQNVKTLKSWMYIIEIRDCIEDIFDEYNEDVEIRELAIAWQSFYQIQNTKITDPSQQLIINQDLISEYQKSMTNTKTLKDTMSKGYTKGYSKGNTNFMKGLTNNNSMVFMNTMGNQFQSFQTNIEAKRSSQNQAHRNSIFKNNPQGQVVGFNNRRSSVQQQAVSQKKLSYKNHDKDTTYIEPIDDIEESSGQNDSSNNIETSTIMKQVVRNKRHSNPHDLEAASPKMLNLSFVNGKHQQINNNTNYTLSNHQQQQDTHKQLKEDEQNGTYCEESMSQLSQNLNRRSKQKISLGQSLNQVNFQSQNDLFENSYINEQQQQQQSQQPQFLNPNLIKDNTTNQIEREIELQNIRIKKQNMDDWDLQNFDKPKNYEIYMPYNNLNAYTFIEAHEQSEQEELNEQEENFIGSSKTNINRNPIQKVTKNQDIILDELNKIKEKQNKANTLIQNDLKGTRTISSPNYVGKKGINRLSQQVGMAGTGFLDRFQNRASVRGQQLKPIQIDKNQNIVDVNENILPNNIMDKNIDDSNLNLKDKNNIQNQQQEQFQQEIQNQQLIYTNDLIKEVQNKDNNE